MYFFDYVEIKNSRKIINEHDFMKSLPLKGD